MPPVVFRPPLGPLQERQLNAGVGTSTLTLTSASHDNKKASTLHQARSKAHATEPACVYAACFTGSTAAGVGSPSVDGLQAPAAGGQCRISASTRQEGIPLVPAGRVGVETLSTQPPEKQRTGTCSHTVARLELLPSATSIVVATSALQTVHCCVWQAAPVVKAELALDGAQPLTTQQECPTRQASPTWLRNNHRTAALRWS